MMMIICHHIIVHGLRLRNISSPNFEVSNSTYIELVLNSFFVIGVNGFVFISGYFSIKFNLKRVFSILIQAAFYSVTFYLLALSMNWVEFSKTSFLYSFFPISNNVWWFITTFIGLYFVAPFLNAGIKSIGKQELIYILVGMFIFNSLSSFFESGVSRTGYDLFNFVCIYLLASFMRHKELKINRPKLTLFFSTMFISIWGVSLLYFNRHEAVWQLFYYNNPILILSAASLFFIFFNFELKYNRYINLLAQTVLGVYMIHDYPKNRKLLIEIVKSIESTDNIIVIIPLLILLVFSIFLICSLIELLRLKMYDFISKKFYDLRDK